MKIYFNGCSFTYGDELPDPSNQAWPSLVSKLKNINFLNDAISSGTNQRTVYKTLLNKDNYDFFVIAWTTYTRFTEYNPIDNYEINFNPMLNLNASIHYSDDLKQNYKKYKDYGELYYKYWYNEVFQFKQWLQQILLLQSFFTVNNKKYIMINTFDNNLSQWLQPKENFISSTRNLIPFFDYLPDGHLLKEHYDIQSLVKDIDLTKFAGWGQWAIADLNLEFDVGPGGHFLEDGHIAMAKKITNFINIDDSN